MPARPRRPHFTGSPPLATEPVIRNLLDDLAPALRPLALRLAGGDARRVHVLSAGRCEVHPGPVTPPGRPAM